MYSEADALLFTLPGRGMEAWAQNKSVLRRNRGDKTPAYLEFSYKAPFMDCVPAGVTETCKRENVLCEFSLF